MNAAPRRIVITGFMCAGKTTVAAALARQLDCAMIDLDAHVTEIAHRTPQQIINTDGEPRFREIETRALRDALENADARVIALGGGAWSLERNRALISEYNCLTVWLDAPFALCWRRIEATKDARPLARDRQHARQLYDARRALYALAALRIEIDEHNTDADETATRIIIAIERESDK